MQSLYLLRVPPVLAPSGLSGLGGLVVARDATGLALDATALGTRFVVLAIRVVYRGCAIPVPWVVVPANTKHAWRRERLRLLRRRRPAIPRGGIVLVLTERGLYAPWLFRRLVRLGWHPLLRINTGGTFRPAGTRCLRPLQRCAPPPGARWRGRGTALQHAGRQVACTLLVLWEAGYQEPWLIRTNLPPEGSDAAWVGLRAWIAQGLKITQRAGWQGHRTRMTEPERAARLWLAVAVATLGLLSVGGAAEETMPASTVLDVTALCPGRPRTRRATRLRLVSVFRCFGRAGSCCWSRCCVRSPCRRGALSRNRSPQCQRWRTRPVSRP